jgi:predicted AlkP superfamily pyrophosphatase or phosphodiesterase
MKLFYLFILSVLIAVSGAAQERTRKLVFVIADGIPADVIEKAPAPTLKKIAALGAYARAHVGGDKGQYNQTPTISAVGYNSLLTGTWVNKHNVWDNDIKDPNYHYPTIFKLFKEAHPEKTIGIFSTWTDNRTKLVGESMDITGKIHFDFKADGYELDTIAYPHDHQSLYIHNIDEKVSEEAARTIREQAPDLSWVYLEYTDDMGHRYGDSKQQTDAIAALDEQIARIWDAINSRMASHPEDWLIIITTDHGRDPKTGRNHGGQSDRERTTWITTNAKNLSSYFYKNNPGIVDIMPTIASWMKVYIPRDVRAEIDGSSFIDPISIARCDARFSRDSILLNWTALEKNGKVKIWVATTNHVKEGRKDEYQLVGEVPVSKESYNFSVKQRPSSFYKIVLEGEHNMVNRWVIIK